MKAVLLCAGLGTRLGALTKEVPKPMLPICSEPLALHNVRYLVAQGFNDIAINLFFQGQSIADFLGDGRRFGASIVYAHEPQLSGTAGALRAFRSFLSGTEPFLVLYGDLLIDQPLAELVEQHRTSHAAATLLVHRRRRSNSIVEMDASRRITRFVERPPVSSWDDGHERWVNSGLALLDPAMIARVPPDGYADLPRHVYLPMVEDNHEGAAPPLLGFPLSGYRCAIDSPERYAEACEAFASGRYSVSR